MAKRKKTDKLPKLKSDQSAEDGSNQNTSGITNVPHVPHSTIALSVLIGAIGAVIFGIGTWVGQWWLIAIGVGVTLLGPIKYWLAARRVENLAPLTLNWTGARLVFALFASTAISLTVAGLAAEYIGSSLNLPPSRNIVEILNEETPILTPTNATRMLPDGRILLIDITPEYLTNIFREHTFAEAVNLMAPYWNKWIELDGQVADLQNFFNKDKKVSILTIKRNQPFGEQSAVFIDPTQIERIQPLTKGNPVKARCKIIPSDLRFLLTDCELLDE